MMHPDRLTRVRAQMQAAGVDLLSLPPGDDLFYLVGFTPHPDERPCSLFLTAGDAVFLVPELNAGQARGYVDVPFLTYTDAHGPADALRQARARLGRPRRICVGDTMRADVLLLLQAEWPDSAFVPGSQVMAPVRMIKTADEIDLMRRSAATADVAVDAAFAACRPGVTEAAVARAAADAFAAQGVTQVGGVIVGGGPNSAYPHHATGRRELRAGEPVLVDLGGRLDGYASDITRMAHLGEPSPRYRQVHTAVERAVRAAMDAVKPGEPLAAVDRAARGVIEAAGFGAFFTHRTGHGIGISGHEPPSVTHTNETPMQEGMAFSIEPGIYLEGEFGVRLEEIVVVTSQGAERLSLLPREVRILPV
ncbi:MAG: Xaa-Pro peptidase family protein [Armatimonadota bacterium]|nr:Xaa-Pro peptidase family protein [Armatimonadota bacterium]